VIIVAVGELPPQTRTRMPATTRRGDSASLHQALAAASALLLAWLAFLIPASVLAAPSGSRQPIAVIYPDIGEPYRSVFGTIIEGIDEKNGRPVVRIAVGATHDPRVLAGELRGQGIRVVIALGRNGLKAAMGLEGEIGIVAGGIVGVPEEVSASVSIHSLAPDPGLLFDRLKSMMPAVRRVLVVHDPRQNDWLIRIAREAAVKRGIELIALEASDLRSATLYYQEFFAQADVKTDALWLPQDTTTVEESTVLPMILQESWNRGAVVFSSSVAHVGRGVLFSLYPDNVALGRTLAVSALTRLAANGPPARVVTPLQTVRIAVNVRTARHLGLAISRTEQQSFDLVFPRQ